MTSRCAGPYHLFSSLFFYSVIFLHSPSQAQPEPPLGMIYIPQGYFQMGTSSGKEDEKPMHFVFTPGYFIDKYEVSNKDYEVFTQATGHQSPKFWNTINKRKRKHVKTSALQIHNRK